MMKETDFSELTRSGHLEVVTFPSRNAAVAFSCQYTISYCPDYLLPDTPEKFNWNSFHCSIPKWRAPFRILTTAVKLGKPYSCQESGRQIGWFLFNKKLDFFIWHAAKMLHFAHWFQNCFCFCSRTFPSHVCNFFSTLMGILMGKWQIWPKWTFMAIWPLGHVRPIVESGVSLKRTIKM